MTPAGRPPAHAATAGPCAIGLRKRNAQLNVRVTLQVLDGLDTFPFDRPGRDRKKFRSPAEFMAESPQVRVIIDAKE